MGDAAYCGDCRRSTNTVSDYSTGDVICNECGLVLEENIIDLRPEWRNFADQSTFSYDPTRVGSRINPLFEQDMTPAPILISKSDKGHRFFPTCSWAPSLPSHIISDPHSSLIRAFAAMSTMADRLSLPTTVKGRANEIYKNLKDGKCLGGKDQNATLAACLFIACRLEHSPRTIKEIFSIANGATKKKLTQAINSIEAALGPTIEIGTINARDFLRRFCSTLGFANEEVKTAQEAILKLDELDIRRSPISIAAAVIYMIIQQSENKRLLKDISFATGVTECTITRTYKDLHPHASRLIPSLLVNEKDLSFKP